MAQLATTLANSSRNEVQRQMDDLMTVSAIITDEAINGHNFIQWREMDQRILRDDNDLGYWGAIHRMRWLADSNSVRLENILGENGAKDRRVAESYAYAGYTYVIAGEFMCESPINVSAEVYDPIELAAMAIPRLQKAIAVATASKVGATSAQITQADNIINFAKVTLGRAYLYMGKPAEAAARSERARRMEANPPCEESAAWQPGRDFQSSTGDGTAAARRLEWGASPSP